MELALSIRGLTEDADALIAPSSLAVKNKLLVEAAKIEVVKTHEEYESAKLVWNELKDFSKGIDHARTTIKAPVLDLGRKIDTTAKNFVSSIDSEISRINKLSSDYLRLEEIKRQELIAAEQKRQAEAIAEAKRQEAELQAKLTKTKSEGTKEIIKEEISQVQEKTLEVLRESQTAIVESKTTGVRKDWEVSVTDIHALYAYNKNLCKVEPSLVDIKALIKLNKGSIQIPGVVFVEKIGMVR